MNLSRRWPLLIGAVGVALVFGLAGFSVYQYNQAKLYERHLGYGYLRSLQQLSDSLHSVSVDLEKASYSGTTAGLTEVSARLWRESGTAKTAMSTLPMGEGNLQETTLFLSQVGDYAMALLRSAAVGEPLTTQQQQELTQLVAHARTLTDSVDLLENGVSSGEIPLHYVALGYLREGGDTALDQNPTAEVMVGGTTDEAVGEKEEQVPTGSAHEQIYTAMEEGFAGYPRLIYDGPFSTHLDDQNPAMLKNLQHVTMEQAKGRVASMLGVALADISFDGDEHSALEAYRFNDGAGQVMALTKQGGLVSYYHHDRAAQGQQVSINEAKEMASATLIRMGFYDMQSSYYEVSSDICTFNYAYVREGVVCYTDLVKVGVALDTGEVVKVDARGYLMNHSERLFATPGITVAQAQESLSGLLEVQSYQLALIPSPGMEERLCYEFYCTGTDRRPVLVYINAQNAQQEQLLLLEIGDNGRLTV